MNAIATEFRSDLAFVYVKGFKSGKGANGLNECVVERNDLKKGIHKPVRCSTLESLLGSHNLSSWMRFEDWSCNIKAIESKGMKG